MTPNDIQVIKDRSRKSSLTQASKVDYRQVLNDIKMKLDVEGKVNWVFSAGGAANRDASPYRIKITKLNQNEDTMSLMSGNHFSQ